jgi:hypothetical protein
MAHPVWSAQVHTLHESGDSENMGTVGDIDSKARFKLDVEACYPLIYARGTFLSGTSQADLTINVDSRLVSPGLMAYEDGTPTDVEVATPHDHTLLTVPDVGTDGNRLNMRVLEDELQFYTFWRDPETDILDVCVLTWTNPNTQRWAIEVGLVDTSAIFGWSART